MGDDVTIQRAMASRPADHRPSRTKTLLVGATIFVAGAAVAGYVVYENEFGRARQQPQPPPPSEKVLNAPGPDNSIRTLEGPMLSPQPATSKPESTK